MFVSDAIDSFSLMPETAEKLDPMIRGLIITLDEMEVACDSIGLEATRDTIRERCVNPIAKRTW